WGGNVTSDNISPIHLMDIKRVAFETKSINGKLSRAAQAVAPSAPSPATTALAPPTAKRPDREQIAAIVDGFLRKKLAEVTPPVEKVEAPAQPTQPRPAAP